MANISQNVNIEMLEKLPDGTYRKKNPATKAEVVKLVDAQNKFTNKNVEGAMNELFTNASNGKNLVGGAITGVDDSVVIPTDPTFQDLADAIGNISTGKKWASGVALYNSNGLTVSGLGFKPSLIIFNTKVDQRGAHGGMYWADFYTKWREKYWSGSYYTATDVAYGRFNIDNDGFSVTSPYGNYPTGESQWIAFE